MSASRPLQIDRLQFAEGQTLRADDLGDLLSSATELQWWHNRAVHHAFGFVRVAPKVLAEGNHVTIAPFLACDSYGRFVSSCARRSVPFPTMSMAGPQPPMLLVARHCQDDRDPTRATLVWVRDADFNIRIGVPVARLLGDTARSLDPQFLPPLVRAMSRVRMGSGTTQPAWRILDAAFQRTHQLLAFEAEADVDTSGTGFVDDPVYLAYLNGKRIEALGRSELAIVQDRIVARSRRSFTVRIEIAFLADETRLTAVDEVVQLDRADQQARLHHLLHKLEIGITWIGAEPTFIEPFSCKERHDCR